MSTNCVFISTYRQNKEYFLRNIILFIYYNIMYNHIMYNVITLTLLVVISYTRYLIINHSFNFLFILIIVKLVNLL